MHKKAHLRRHYVVTPTKVSCTAGLSLEDQNSQ
jgi:hypothetical protein